MSILSMCTHEYRRQRRLQKQKQDRRCGVNCTVDQNRAIVDALSDPLYQLFIHHMVFRRLAQEIFSASQQPHAVTHRTMRRPARFPSHGRPNSCS